MRETLSISLPPSLKKEIDQIVKSGMYASTSELIREALRELSNKIAIREILASQAQARVGRVKKLVSFKDLR